MTEPGAPPSHGARRIDLLGIPLDVVSTGDVLRRVQEAVEGTATGRAAPLRHVALNANKWLSAKENPLLAAAIRGAGLVSADGMGVLLLARRLGHRFPERVTGIDTMRRVVNLAAQRGWPIFLLGAEAGVAEAAAQALKAEAPGLHVAGTAHGWFADAEAASVAEGVARSGASVLFVAMGTPRQEWFAAEFGERCGVRYVLGVGGAFDVLSGRRRRAPGLVQRAGLEWLFRWAQEPSRLAGRYGWGGFRFAREFLRARRGRG